MAENTHDSAPATGPIFAKPDPALKTIYEYLQPKPEEIKEIVMYGELAQVGTQQKTAAQSYVKKVAPFGLYVVRHLFRTAAAI